MEIVRTVYGTGCIAAFIWFMIRATSREGFLALLGWPVYIVVSLIWPIFLVLGIYIHFQKLNQQQEEEERERRQQEEESLLEEMRRDEISSRNDKLLQELSIAAVNKKIYFTSEGGFELRN